MTLIPRLWPWLRLPTVAIWGMRVYLVTSIQTYWWESQDWLFGSHWTSWTCWVCNFGLDWSHNYLIFLSRAMACYWISQLTIAAGPSGAHIKQHLAQANETLEATHSAVLAVEAKSSFILPWKPDSPQHLEAISLCQQWDYHQLLDELEQWAISCQLEIERINLPKTGENGLPQHSSHKKC